MISATRELIAREQRSHTLIVGIGLYILRYASAETANDCPFVTVTPSPRDGRGISLISVPGGSDTDLAAPGDCMVVKAEHPGALDLTVSATRTFGSLEAELRLERIECARTVPAAHSLPRTSQTADLGSVREVSILAHVSRRGDVVCGQGEWVCGPDHPLPIEGLEIQWLNKPPQVDIRYTVAVNHSKQKRVLERGIGQFAGTRGKAAPIVGLGFALSGPDASDYEMRVDALFLGAPITSKSGSELTFSGPTGREPMVGLRLAVLVAENHRDRVSRTTQPKSIKPWGQVRVYRPPSVSAARPTDKKGDNRWRHTT